MRSLQSGIKVSFGNTIKQVARCEAQIERLVQGVCPPGTRGVHGMGGPPLMVKTGSRTGRTRGASFSSRTTWNRRKKTVRHCFALEGDKLTKRDGGSRAFYIKCRERDGSR
ncbi:hypothetical protein LEN_3063 [Lysobacter enzymogenes]|uniref:Uncharacterized protein n=1 Tax=Lysobacter enzymogenes TaxID=69 RepID=A0AAU9AHB6_LYSEN|nr:hypothetical protein LEN_3063 [Lysobacter enzymogenes]